MLIVHVFAHAGFIQKIEEHHRIIFVVAGDGLPKSEILRFGHNQVIAIGRAGCAVVVQTEHYV